MYEGPLPGSESQLVPIRYVCTYTQTVPNVTIVHTDIAGTMIAVLPLAILIACLSIRWASMLRMKSIENHGATAVGSRGSTGELLDNQPHDGN